MNFHPRNRLSATDAALVAAHIETNGVTICPPFTYTEAIDVIVPMREQIRRAAVAGKAEVGVKDAPKGRAKRNRLAGQNARRASSKAERLEAVAAMIREGADLDKIATKFGVSFKTVQKDRTALAREGRL